MKPIDYKAVDYFSGRLQFAASAKNVAKSIRAFIRFKKTGKQTSPDCLAKNRKPRAKA